jgi:DNA topoisomerase III
VDFSAQQSLGACPKCKGAVFEFGSNYLCEHSVGATVTCDFKTGKIILQQPVPPEDVVKLLTTGKTSLLENFVSNKTRRKFKAYLAFDAKEGRVAFEFEPRASKFPPKAGKGKSEGAAAAEPDVAVAKKVAAKKAPAKRATAKKTAA